MSPPPPLKGEQCVGTQRSAILHYHLFKNAGSSLDALFREAFPDAWVTAEFPEDPATNRASLADWIRTQSQAVCFSSHTALLPPPRLAEVTLTPVIFLRHPLDRIASAYSFEAQQLDDGFGATLARNTTLRGYIKVRLSMESDRQCRNFQTDRLAGFLGDDEGTERERALRAVEELPFVGVVEKFDRSLRKLERVLDKRGFSGIRLRSARRNVSRGRADSLGARLERMAHELGDEVFEELARANSDDLAVYRAALARIEE